MIPTGGNSRMRAMSIKTRISRLEQVHAESSARAAFDVEWWKWRRAERRGEVYTPKLPNGVSFDDWQAVHLAYEQSPEGRAWLAVRRARLANG